MTEGIVGRSTTHCPVPGPPGLRGLVLPSRAPRTRAKVPESPFRVGTSAMPGVPAPVAQLAVTGASAPRKRSHKQINKSAADTSSGQRVPPELDLDLELGGGRRLQGQRVREGCSQETTF